MSKEKCWVFDGENYSHGETLRQAKADLIFKLSNRDTSQYENLTTESVITYADAVQQATLIRQKNNKDEKRVKNKSI